MHRAFADKLLDLAEGRAEEIAKRWYKSVTASPRTPSYHSLPEEECLAQAASVYKNLRRIYVSEDPYHEAWDYFSAYAEARHAEGIPLYELTYALILMRRHIWLFAELQAMFTTAIELNQAVQSINRTILVFDYAIYIVNCKYEEITKPKSA